MTTKKGTKVLSLINMADERFDPWKSSIANFSSGIHEGFNWLASHVPIKAPHRSSHPLQEIKLWRLTFTCKNKDTAPRIGAQKLGRVSFAMILSLC